jgi:uncharacterized membrane protein YagU involved in acid resistance
MEMQTIKENSMKGVIAGATSVAAMDYLVTWPVYKLEDREAYKKEKELQPEGRWAAHVFVSRISRMLGLNLSENKIFKGGKAQHFMMGIAPAILYATYYKKYPMISAGYGALYGSSLFLLADELMVPALKLSGPNTKYPWQAHLRGFLGHVMVGVVTHGVLRLLDRRKELAA